MSEDPAVALAKAGSHIVLQCAQQVVLGSGMHVRLYLQANNEELLICIPRSLADAGTHTRIRADKVAFITLIWCRLNSLHV